MIDTDPVITLPMNVPSGLAAEPAPFPFATYRVEPSAETATAVGYQPTGMSPATRIALGSSRTTATALLPAIATYSVRPSGARASAFGSLPTGARGVSATVSCSITRPVATSTRATPFEPARATNRSVPRKAMADGWGPTKRDGRTLGRSDRSITAMLRSEEHTSELQSRPHLVCRLLLEKKKKKC